MERESWPVPACHFWGWQRIIADCRYNRLHEEIIETAYPDFAERIQRLCRFKLAPEVRQCSDHSGSSKLYASIEKKLQTKETEFCFQNKQSIFLRLLFPVSQKEGGETICPKTRFFWRT